MYAVAFDLVVSDTEKHHPKGIHKPMLKLALFCLVMDSSVFKAALQVNPKNPSIPCKTAFLFLRYSNAPALDAALR